MALHRSDVAWLTLVTGALCYNLTAPEGELLSEAADRYRTRHCWVIRLLIFATALHLTRTVPRCFDVYHLPWAAKCLIVKRRGSSE